MTTVTTRDPALTSLLTYYDGMEKWDIDQSVSVFAEECEYRHPPFAYGGDKPNQYTEESTGFVLARNHTELRGILELMRDSGLTDPVFRITGFARNGDLCFCEGYGGLRDKPMSVTWLATFTVDSANRIVKYLPYRAIPPLPLLGSGPMTL